MKPFLTLLLALWLLPAVSARASDMLPYVGKPPSEGGSESFLNVPEVQSALSLLGSRSVSIQEVMLIEEPVVLQGNTVVARFSSEIPTEGWKFLTIVLEKTGAYAAVCLAVDNPDDGKPLKGAWRISREDSDYTVIAPCETSLENLHPPS